MARGSERQPGGDGGGGGGAGGLNEVRSGVRRVCFLLPRAILWGVHFLIGGHPPLTPEGVLDSSCATLCYVFISNFWISGSLVDPGTSNGACPSAGLVQRASGAAGDRLGGYSVTHFRAGAPDLASGMCPSLLFHVLVSHPMINEIKLSFLPGLCRGLDNMGPALLGQLPIPSALTTTWTWM